MTTTLLTIRTEISTSAPTTGILVTSRCYVCRWHLLWTHMMLKLGIIPTILPTKFDTMLDQRVALGVQPIDRPPLITQVHPHYPHPPTAPSSSSQSENLTLPLSSAQDQPWPYVHPSPTIASPSSERPILPEVSPSPSRRKTATLRVGVQIGGCAMLV